MNRKILLVFVALMAVAMLTSFAVPALAATKEKVTFKLNILGTSPSGKAAHDAGYIRVSPESKYPPSSTPPAPPPEDYLIVHYVDCPYNPSDVWIEVNGITIPFARITYTAETNGMLNWQTGAGNFQVDESVVIYTDASKTVIWGTLDIRTVERYVFYPSSTLGVYGTFVGQGTGALEGVKVQGDSGRFVAGGPRVRDGFAVGWP